jgi:hypothetical protein
VKNNMSFGREDKNEDLCSICAVGIPNLNESNTEGGNSAICGFTIM